ncbi:imidazole glycerol phosphate synthase subunit HisH [Roseospira goensis]|uniref:Imidazole glycerol phosphate synthase subunit HisH n=1 Tax=Roseospira goensis TaxID=391922 RepID=A0A7W6RY23_9PROT|nr:imidazole glycerol phosphate synthase subunit HisH [Roseospira goensis]MBB4285333.1 glutamine amidotransferase [Roseospira goensis]
MSVAIIDYGSGNLRSAAKAFERAALESKSAARIVVTSRPDDVRRADRVVLPGVGAFGDCKRGLDAVAGMAEALTEAVRDRGRPFLGICVGMQLMAREGHEHGTHPGLGWIDGVVDPIRPADPALKVPHMGWNTLTLTQPDHPVLAGVHSGQHTYFVHSYAVVLDAPDQALATTDYGGPITAMVGRDTMVGTQFHPEKSQATGLRLIANFLRWTP